MDQTGASPQPPQQDGHKMDMKDSSNCYNKLPQYPVLPPILPVPSKPALSAPIAMNWSYDKPEFSGKLEKDPEAHLFRTIAWMDTHNFASKPVVHVVPVVLLRLCVSIQAIVLNRCASGSFSNFPENSGLSYDQFMAIGADSAGFKSNSNISFILAGEPRVWYQSTHPFQGTWKE